MLPLSLPCCRYIAPIFADTSYRDYRPPGVAYRGESPDMPLFPRYYGDFRPHYRSFNAVTAVFLLSHPHA